MKKLRILLSSAVLLSSLLPMHVKANDRIQTLISNMSLEQKISQMLMPDFRKWQMLGEEKETDFTEMNAEISDIIASFDFGGVILFAENVKTTDQTLKLTHDYQKFATEKSVTGSIPLLLSIDQEGGRVYRLGSGTALPGNMALGATRSEHYAKEAGAIIGRELSALGINTNFAPVFDINNNPLNPVIGLRSFSSDPDLVGKLGVAMMKGMHENNIITVAKHFPGHGDTATDSHTGLPLVNKTKAALLNTELPPFKQAIANGVDMLMTAHIQYPQLEPEKVISKKDNTEIYVPATLSKKIMTDLVRNELGYDGVIVSDAMNMKAIADHFGESEATIRAIKADVDIILMPTILRKYSDIEKLLTIITDVKNAVENGDIPLATINKSVERILKLKEKRGILDYHPNAKSIEEKLAIARKEVGSERNRQLEREIAAEAVTIVKNDDNTLPFKLKPDAKVLLLGAYNNELPGMELTLRRYIAEGFIPNTVQYESFRYSNKTDFGNDLKAKIDQATHVVVISEITKEDRLAPTHWLTNIPTSTINYANEKNIPVAVLSIATPYDVANYPIAKAIVAVYGNKGMDPTEGLKPDAAFGPNIPAGVEVILGRETNGKLPVDVPVIENAKFTEKIMYQIGHGLTYDKTYTQKDETTGITLTFNRKNVLDEVMFTVKKLHDKLDQYANSVVYDITATINGKDASDFTSHPVMITIPLDATFNKVKVLDLTENKVLPHTLENHVVTFKATHFSKYAVVSEKEKEDKPIVQPKPEQPEDKPIVKPNTKPDVDTSDLTYVWAIVAIGALIGIIVSKRKQ